MGESKCAVSLCPAFRHFECARRRLRSKAVAFAVRYTDVQLHTEIVRRRPDCVILTGRLPSIELRIDTAACATADFSVLNEPTSAGERREKGTCTTRDNGDFRVAGDANLRQLNVRFLIALCELRSELRQLTGEPLATLVTETIHRDLVGLYGEMTLRGTGRSPAYLSSCGLPSARGATRCTRAHTQ